MPYTVILFIAVIFIIGYATGHYTAGRAEDKPTIIDLED